ncbi:hypothetical protein [Adhaeribacter pallidiroseus]|uniref:Uncharacterized protein n=1 Tax=Adhaeribacter pallidiroseus TaxID=2072847 RepID=A0A369QG44_9BACT|nr:hypothetical protein [Adhaeribacter pallidiroseus]RDC61869.1 hypothetical protein AHMF7616_00458 [Adhaeribacter pallidiroseus]
MNILYETDKLLIKNEYEVVFLIDKETNQVLVEEEFYGDPTCGLIDTNNEWAVITGEKIIIWTSEETKKIEDKNLRWRHDLRPKDNQTIELLNDPWSENSSIWELDIKTLEYKKIRDFNDYQDQVFVEIVIW